MRSDLAANRWVILQGDYDQFSLATSMTTWYGSWDVFARAEIQKGILGEQSTMDTLNNMAEQWNVLKAAQ